ncbi:replication initiation protein [Thalassorhabdus alkalitolerans]|uniref:Replication initiation protein n=1 Tax=Thalassorhabdus alkalitolerans TaxID=2282697 RepID=A0ABW0YSM2_9BACI
MPKIAEKELNSVVTKSNELIQASYRLGLTEQRVILYLVSKIQPNDEEFKVYTFSIKHFHDILGLKGTPKYSEIKEITRNLMRKVFQVQMDGKLYQMSWLSSVVYNDAEGTISLRFDPVLKPFLLELKKNFTSYKYENVVKLRSSYSIRIYELLKQYEKLKERHFEINEFRSVLGLEDQYKTYGNLKNRVIKPAQKELAEYTDVKFEIKEQKTGRKVTGITFLIDTNKDVNVYLQEDLETGLFMNRIQIFAHQYGFKMSDKDLSLWLENKETVLELIEKIEKKEKGDIQKPFHYINKVLANNEDPPKATDKGKDSLEIINQFIKKYRKQTGTIPAWLIADELEAFMKEKGLSEEEVESHLKEKKEEVINIITTQIKRNREKN